MKREYEEDMHGVVKRIAQIRAGGAVRRCHGIRHGHPYTNAEHQWGCAVLMWCLWPQQAQRLIPYCLFHDVAEAWVGDVPAPTMRYSGVREQIHRLENFFLAELGLPNEVEDRLSEDDKAKLKACDRLELYMWCQEQLLAGNLFASGMVAELDRYFVENPMPDRAAELYNYMRQIASRSLIPVHAGEVKRAAEALAAEDEERAQRFMDQEEGERLVPR